MAKPRRHSIYEFDRFRLDRDKLMVYRDGQALSLPPKAVETLAVLAEHHGAIVSKEELIEAVWQDSIVEDSNLSQYLYLLRKTLGTRPDGSPYIETLRRRGYRFTADVSSSTERPAFSSVPSDSTIRTDRRAVERRGNVLAFVDWQEAQSPAPEVGIKARPEAYSPSVSRRSAYLSLLLLCALVAAIGGGFVIYLRPDGVQVAAGSDNQAETKVTKLTNGNFVWGAAISPDGNYFAYSEIEDKRSRLFVQPTGENSRVELVSMPDGVISGTTFSPDGRWVYFWSGRKDGKEENKGNLYRVPTIGGPATRLLSGPISTITFSPDAKEMAFTRVNAADDTSIAISDIEGRAERLLLHKRGLVTIGSNAAWSPDGTKIAFSEIDRTRSPVASRLRLIDVSSGIVSPLSDEAWDVLTRIEWVPDGTGIVTNGTRSIDRKTPVYHYNVYHVSYPGGVSRRISNDGNRHEISSLGITKDKGLLIVPSTRACQIWSMSASGDASTARQLTRGSADGRAGLVSLSDGRIAYTARTAENLTIWTAKEDGSEAQPLPTGFDFNEELRVDPAGRFLVFSSLQDSTHHLFRINPDGSDLRQLTFGNTNEIDSTVSPDGKTIVTHSDDIMTNPPKTVLKRLSAEGGESQTLKVENCVSPVFSPDGSMLSCIRDGMEAMIVAAADGSIIETIPLPPGSVANFGAVWTPDATGLVVMMHKGTTSNLTVLPRDRRKPYNLTNFTSGTIYRFAFSHDGSRLFVARGYPTQDAVLIRNAL